MPSTWYRDVSMMSGKSYDGPNVQGDFCLVSGLLFYFWHDFEKLRSMRKEQGSYMCIGASKEGNHPDRQRL